MKELPPRHDMPNGLFKAVLADAYHFPDYIRRRGRSYFEADRVGPLEIDGLTIRAQVRGTRTYRTAWKLIGGEANPVCSCPAGPVCKHSFALALAIEASDPLLPWIKGRPPRPQPIPRPSTFREVLRQQNENADAGTAEDLAEWARQQSGSTHHTVRAVLGLEIVEANEPMLWIELRETSSRLRDAARTPLQIRQLASDLRRDPRLLAPPHARLVRVMARIVPETDQLFDTRFIVRASAVNRLMDSFTASPLVTWAAPAGPAPARGGIEAGARALLGEASLTVVPLSAREGEDLQIMLGARWPDGHTRPLDEVVYLPSDDDLHPSLVLADGKFWRLAEEPPSHLMHRFSRTGGMAVPKGERDHLLGLLASSFSNVADQLGPHIRIHPARPAIALDLGTDDWLRVRLFAHTGGADWRPGAVAPGVVVFELSHEGEWTKVPDAAAENTEALGQMADEEAAAEIAPPENEAAMPASDAAGADANAEPPPAEGDDSASAVWVELPDPAPLASARDWLATLPIRRPAPKTNAHPGPHDRGLWIRFGSRTIHVFAEKWEQRPRDVLYLGNERMQSLLGSRRLVRTRVTVTSSGVDWLTVSAQWEAEGQRLTEQDLAKLRAASGRFVKLASGWVSREWIAAFDAEAAMLADLGLEAGGGEQKLTLAQLAQAKPESLAALGALGADERTLAELERLREQVKSFAGIPRVALPVGLVATLRPYQHDGLDFLAFVTGLGLGAVLADDMGLGKTVQALAWIDHLRERDPQGGPVLVVCPASVVHNWQRESERFTPHLRVLVLASGEERHALRQEVPAHDLVITNYALLRRDIEHWRKIRLRAAILDEAQNIKNPQAAVSRATLELDAKYRLALTGTPIENRALDLWSIMQFLNPGYLGTRSQFIARFDRPDAPPHARRLLAARLRPVMLRRLKEQVAPELPDRIEERLECELTPGQRRLYLAERMRGRDEVARLSREPGGIAARRIEVLALLTRLRQVCCHPALVRGREDLGSGKFDALFELLEPLMAEGRKVLVFSQFVECLKLLGAEMKRRGIRHHLLTGATTRREQVVSAFENDPQPCVFLISLKAGGTGLNLTAAQYVVLFDPWWNPAVEAQAIDRTHRIGQTRTVIAYRLMSAGTIEEKIWELQQKKQAIVSEVLGEDGFAKTLTAGDLDYLLS